jgi:uncharacterized membrane protein YesL
LFFIVGCLPILTAGASIAALYDAVYRGFRCGERNTWIRFWRTFLKNLKPSLLPALLFWAAAGALSYGMVQCWNSAVYGHISWMLFAAMMLLAVLAAGILSVLFPMLSRFENSTAALLRNTVLLSLANLPRALLLGIINAIAMLLCFRLLIPLFFLPALAALAGTLCIEPMFRPYLREATEEETEVSEEAAE